MSVAGGLPLAVDRAALHGCQSLQIFTKNASQWRGRVLPPEEIRAFCDRVRATGIAPAVSHASYLINLASTDPTLRRQSIEAMADEIDRAEALRLMGVVLHPGASADADKSGALSRIADALSGILLARREGRTMVLLEHTAGQGNALGSRFDELALIIERMNGNARVGVCLDTCHLLASGYDIASPDGYAATFDEFSAAVGLDRLRAFHLNDSRKPLGSRVDRHAHIGEGYLGVDTFRRLLNDSRFADLPMLLETPKDAAGRPNLVAVDRCDQQNLTVLKRLLAA